MDEIVPGRWPALDRTVLRSGHLQLALLIAVASLAGMVALGARTPAVFATALLASAGAGLVVVLVPSRPIAAFGVLILLASISGQTLDLSVGRVRLEQPAIIAAVVALTLSRRWPRWAEVRPVSVIVLAFAAYLVVMVLSSILFAPQITTSARLLIWTGISMCGGAVAFTLMIRLARGAEGWFTATGVLYAIVALAIAAVFLIAGPDGIPGMQLNRGEPPKVSGLAWEANLFASFLGAMAPFALEYFRTRVRVRWATPAVLIIVALGLGVTRGAYIGLAAGLIVYLLALVIRSAVNRSSLRRVVAVIAIAAVLAPVGATVLLPGQRPSFLATWYTSLVKPSPAGSGSPGGSGGTTPTPTPMPTPLTDTLEWRIDRLPTALNETKGSPIIGLGAATFGQRHDIPGQPGQPDYLAILAVVTLYESGVLGTLALGVGMLLVLWMLFRASKFSPGPAAAFGGSLVSLLVAYESTNALFFSFNWLIIGAALAFAVRTIRENSGQPESTAA